MYAIKIDVLFAMVYFFTLLSLGMYPCLLLVMWIVSAEAGKTNTIPMLAFLFDNNTAYQFIKIFFQRVEEHY